MSSRRAFIKLAGLSVLLAVSTATSAATPEERRRKVRKQSQEVLARLYKSDPAARNVVKQAAGYATFHRIGLKMGVAGGGGGRGLVVAQDGTQTFMKYLELSAGVGLGIKSYDLIFVFDTEQALADFVNKGWEYGGQATAAAKAGDSGKALSGAQTVSPGVRVYQLTSAGLSAELTVAGTRYFKDDKLNQ